MTHAILSKLAKNRDSLLAAVADLSEEELDTRSADGWTIRQILTHLVNAEEDHRSVIQAIRRGEAHLVPRQISLDEYNARRLDERGTLARQQLLDALQEQRQETEHLFQELSENQLNLPGTHPVIGDTTVADIFRIIALHDRMHTQDIRALLRATRPASHG